MDNGVLLSYSHDMTTEEWKEVRPNLFVSRGGGVRRRGSSETIGVGDDPNRYVSTSWSGNTVGVHRLVAEAFLGPRPSSAHQVNHKNGVKCDNRAENLEWVTGSENMRHSVRLHGIRGEGHPNSKLKASDIPTIRARLSAGESQSRVARDYGISQGAICKIAKRMNWAWVE